MHEIWLPVVGYEGYYEVSNLGHIRNCRIKKFGPKGDCLRPQKIGKYLGVNLCANGKSKVFLIHRLVAGAFLGPCPPSRDVNHKDGDRTHNAVDNLEYVTRRENIDHSMRMGLTPKGERIPYAKLSEFSVSEIRQSDERTQVLAEKYGVDTTTILLAKAGKTWKHVLTPPNPRGRDRGMRHPFAKLNDTLVQAIRNSTERDCEIAKQLGVDDETIRAIRIGRNWRHVGGPIRSHNQSNVKPWAKLREADVRSIRINVASNKTMAQQFGVNPSVISMIRRLKSWAWVV